VFIDTPGFHLSDKKINKHMIDLISSSLDEVELVLYVLDGSRPPGPEEAAIVDMLESYQSKLIAAGNKIDLPGSAADELREYIEERLPKARFHSISALKGTGIDELTAALFSLAPEGEQMYPEEFYTDQEPSFRISEIIRDKALSKVREEVPHALYVDIADLEIKPASGSSNAEGSAEKADTLWIRAFLVVERDSQQGILIGKGGKVIKAIRQEAQREIAEAFPYKIYLDLRVKVNPKWRRKDKLLNKLIQ